MVADYVKLIGAQNIHKMKPQEMKFSLIKVNIDKWWGVGEWTMPRCHVEPTISPSFPVPEPTSTRRCAKCWEIYGLGCRGELGIMHREKWRQITVIHNMCLRYRFQLATFLFHMFLFHIAYWFAYQSLHTGFDLLTITYDFLSVYVGRDARVAVAASAVAGECWTSNHVDVARVQMRT